MILGRSQRCMCDVKMDYQKIPWGLIFKEFCYGNVLNLCVIIGKGKAGVYSVKR